MHRLLRLALAVAAIGQAAQAWAADPAIVACHNCTDRKAALTAEAQVPRSAPAGVYDVYVVDTPGNSLRRYRVTAEREHRLAENFAQQRTPSAEYLDHFRRAKSEWDYVGLAVKPNIVLPADFPVQSAEAVIGSEFNQTVISEQLNRHVPTRIASLFGSALLMMRTVFTSEILAEVEFPDGSRALFTLQRIDSLTSGHMFVYRYKPGSAVDSEGNGIPDSPSSFDNYQGRFGERKNLDRFRRRADIYGADWADPPVQIEVLPAHTICARDDLGNIFCWHR